MKIEQQLKIEEFKSKLSPTYAFYFNCLCQSLILFDNLMKEHNISFDDITFEMIFNEFNQSTEL